MNESIDKAVEVLKRSKHTMAFTGAGISVESGVPAFRGSQGLWSKYDPRVLDIDYFLEHGDKSWPYIKEIFYDHFGQAEPNPAHLVLARMEETGLLECVVTQNIDNLHQRAGSRRVYEFHGNSSRLVCPRCGNSFSANKFDLTDLPPLCPRDKGILKPDFIFFGEGIPAEAFRKSFENAGKCEVCLIVGSTGEVMPAAQVPVTAKEKGAFIIEINPEASRFTDSITDLYIKGKAGETFQALERKLFGPKK